MSIQKNRIEKLTRNCNILGGVGLEFGALASPIVRKEQGSVFYADYTSTESLRSKSRTDPNVKVDEIVDIDIDLSVVGLAEALSKFGGFDYVLASHVFEHIPNPVGWLRKVTRSLNAGGVISLAIPDRRYTYDFYRTESTFEQLLAYDLEDLQRPSAFQLADHYFNVAQVNTLDSWHIDYRSTAAQRYHSDEIAHWQLEQWKSGSYIDCHCTVWTAEHFGRIFPRIAQLVGERLSILDLHEPEMHSNEFIVQLRKQ